MADSRTLESLTKLERAWLRRRFCGWCDISPLSKSCGQIFDLAPRCDMNERRANALKQYKPRKAAP